MEVDYLLLFLHAYINIVYSLVIVNKYELPFFSAQFPLPFLHFLGPALFHFIFFCFCSPGSSPSLVLSLLLVPLLTGSFHPSLTSVSECTSLWISLCPFAYMIRIPTLPWHHVALSPLCVFFSLLSPSLSLFLFPCLLLGELYDLDAASLQLKVINYVSSWNHSSSFFHHQTKTHTQAKHPHQWLLPFILFQNLLSHSFSPQKKPLHTLFICIFMYRQMGSV